MVNPINIKNTPISEQLISKKIGAEEVNKELKKDRTYSIIFTVGFLLVFGLTNLNTLLGGATAIMLVGVISYRLAEIQKKMNYFKSTYGVE